MVDNDYREQIKKIALAYANQIKKNIIEPHPFLADEFNMSNPNAYVIIETGIRIIKKGKLTRQFPEVNYTF